MSLQDAYAWLTSLKGFRVMWDRQDSETIWVATDGYKTHFEDGHYGIEAVLIKAGFRMISEEFDSMCGKTFAYYRHAVKE